MYGRRRIRPKYTYSAPDKKAELDRVIVLVLIAAVSILVIISTFLRELSTKIAVSDAVDIVTKTVNDAINETISSGGFDVDYFIELKKDESGSVAAITSNMAHINLLSTTVLNSVIASTDNGVIKVKIPLGNLTGLNLLMGKGPDVSIDIIMLTSSKVDFKNEITPCGINQTKYQLMLEICVDVDVIVPWGTQSAQTVTEVIVADTVIIGDVPQTYLNGELIYGRE